ncbi:hypothetical protein I040019C4_14530 [Bifidobacterium longum]|nr:hypothetical protein BLGA_13160 [Bifidobacterium longum subsp. longum]GHM67203.1 hypothetical protein MCC00231_12660 [Bifidobacterium longum subsp. longum]
MVPDSFWLTKTPLCFSGIRTKVNGQRRLTRRWAQSLTPLAGLSARCRLENVRRHKCPPMKKPPEWGG